MHILVLWSFFGTNTIGEAKELSDSTIIPNSNNWSISFRTNSFFASGSRYGLCLIFSYPANCILCSILSVLPGRSVNISWNSISRSTTSCFCLPVNNSSMWTSVHVSVWNFWVGKQGISSELSNSLLSFLPHWKVWYVFPPISAICLRDNFKLLCFPLLWFHNQHH